MEQAINTQGFNGSHNAHAAQLILKRKMEDEEEEEFGIFESSEPPSKKACWARSSSAGASDSGGGNRGSVSEVSNSNRNVGGGGVVSGGGGGVVGGGIGVGIVGGDVGGGGSLLGARVSKWFGAYGMYGGTVLACKSPEHDETQAEREWYTVEYDDGDCEDLFREQVEQILLLEHISGQRGGSMQSTGGRKLAHYRSRTMPPLRAGTRIWFRFEGGLAGGFVTQPVKGRQGDLGWAQVSFDDCTKLIVKLDPLTQGVAWDLTSWSDTGADRAATCVSAHTSSSSHTDPFPPCSSSTHHAQYVARCSHTYTIPSVDVTRFIMFILLTSRES